MTLFYTREYFERECRKAGITDMAYNADKGEYRNPHTQRTFQVWESVAQSRNACKRPTAWLTRRRGKDQGISPVRPYTTLTPSEWAQKAAQGWEQPLALWPAMPVASASADAILAERERQKWVKGYHPALDQRYQNDELLKAATAYRLQHPESNQTLIDAFWPWPSVPMKREDRLRAIEKAAALLLAEHERICAEGAQ
ncbi:hypothetical protein [Pseudomonas sp. NPDC090208]|uniref:hypothetical protein n=1 Tax=Pseudomonas sp. NPDC090208 TaxID=3364478 RepID=UPI003805794D